MARTRKTYSDSLKKKVVNAIDGGLTQKEAARKFKVGINSIPQWLKAHRADAKGATKTASLNSLVRRLAQLDMEREQIKKAIKAAIE